MFCLNDTMRYHLCAGRTDMRKGINSLIGVVKDQMGSDVRNGDVFIFIGSSRRLMKLLHALLRESLRRGTPGTAPSQMEGVPSGGNHDNPGATTRKVTHPINDNVGYNLSKL